MAKCTTDEYLMQKWGKKVTWSQHLVPGDLERSLLHVVDGLLPSEFCKACGVRQTERKKPLTELQWTSQLQFAWFAMAAKELSACQPSALLAHHAQGVCLEAWRLVARGVRVKVETKKLLLTLACVGTLLRLRQCWLSGTRRKCHARKLSGMFPVSTVQAMARGRCPATLDEERVICEFVHMQWRAATGSAVGGQHYVYVVSTMEARYVGKTSGTRQSTSHKGLLVRWWDHQHRMARMAVADQLERKQWDTRYVRLRGRGEVHLQVLCLCEAAGDEASAAEIVAIRLLAPNANVQSNGDTQKWSLPGNVWLLLKFAGSSKEYINWEKVQGLWKERGPVGRTPKTRAPGRASSCW